MLSKVDWMI